MSSLIKVLCVLLVIAGSLPWLLMAGFSPAMLDSASTMTRVQKVIGSSVVLAIWVVPVWVAYFGWRTIKTWSTPSVRNAILMALPALAMIGFIVWVNVFSFAP
jgi:hypothetical protein